MKLQDAYIAEVGNAIGGWKIIGYKMDNSNNFKYDGTYTDATTVGLSSGLAKGWEASNIATLNDCAANKKWQLDVKANATTGGSAKYEAKVSDGSGGDCDILTPNFKALDTDDGIVADAS